MILNECRFSGNWIIGGQSVVYRHIYQYVFCRRVHAAAQTQKMADLPDDRLAQRQSFTYTAVDFFGPFEVREGR